MKKHCVFVLLFAIGIFSGVQLSAAAKSHIIDIEPNDKGRVFEAVGALSAGASSRLLIDYPEPQRSIVLDLLFKPKYGASFHHLKVEVGSQANSTDGTEPTHARTKDEMLNPKPEYYHRGYEWWLMKEAKKRNPAVMLDALAWGAPGWIGNGDFFSQDMADYYVAFIRGAEKYHDLIIDYIGIWNEKRYKNPETLDWIKMLRWRLNDSNLEDVQIVAADQNFGQFTIVKDAAKDPELMDAISVFGDHYLEWSKGDRQYKTSDEAIASGKPLWNAEAGPWKGRWDDVPYIAKLNNRCYIEGKMTKIISWSLVSSYYDTLSLASSGPMRANTPWCGAFEIQPAIWANAHTTQFTAPGWKYADSGCGYLPKKTGSYVTLRKPGKEGDFSIIIETVDANEAQDAVIKLPKDFSDKKIHVWRSIMNKEAFIQQNDITAENRTFSIKLLPKAIYSLTTTTGQQKAMPESPELKPFPFPYKEDFEDREPGFSPKYMSDIQGVFEVAKRPDGKGKCLRQVVVKAPIYWQGTVNGKANHSAILGDEQWTDYHVKTEAYMEESGTVKVFCRLGRGAMNRGKDEPRGYFIEADTAGKWRLCAKDMILAEGDIKFPQETWHTLGIQCAGTEISATINGKQVAQVDVSGKLNKKGKSIEFKEGLAGLGSEFNRVLFDNLCIESIK